MTNLAHSMPENLALYDATAASALIGQYVLIGETHFDKRGILVKQIQCHGTIVAASPAGIVVSLEGAFAGARHMLPAMPHNFQPAQPGKTYALRSTGEEVQPDLVSTWDMHEPETPDD